MNYYSDKSSTDDRLNSLKDVRVYSLPEIAPVLGVTRPTLMGYIKSGRLRAAKIGGRWVVSHESLKRLVEGA